MQLTSSRAQGRGKTRRRQKGCVTSADHANGEKDSEDNEKRGNGVVHQEDAICSAFQTGRPRIVGIVINIDCSARRTWRWALSRLLVDNTPPMRMFEDENVLEPTEYLKRIFGTKTYALCLPRPALSLTISELTIVPGAEGHDLLAFATCSCLHDLKK